MCGVYDGCMCVCVGLGIGIARLKELSLKSVNMACRVAMLARFDNSPAESKPQIILIMSKGG